jgi:hypothetical protein
LDKADTILGSFSINGIKNLKQYDNGQTVNGDFGDWINKTDNDSFTGMGHPGQNQCVTKMDLQEMNILGWQLASTAFKVASQCVPLQK